jgi:hypothetical protein
MSCTCSEVIAGASGFAKAVLGVDRAAESVRSARVEACRGCDRRADRDGGGLKVLSRCRECGCYIGLKVKVAGETCPLGRWPVTSPAPNNS